MSTLFRKLFSGRKEAVPEENFYISSGLQFFGDLVAASSSGRIEGKFDGHIIECKKLIVGPKATIKGNIFAQEVFVHGYCEGNIFASKCIKVYDGAVVLGDVHSSAVQVERNATFRGNLRKLKPDDYESLTNEEKEKIRKERKSNVFNIHSLNARNETEQKSRMVANGSPETLSPIAPVTDVDNRDKKALFKKVTKPAKTPHVASQENETVLPFEPGLSQPTDAINSEVQRRWF